MLVARRRIYLPKGVQEGIEYVATALGRRAHEMLQNEETFQ
jgi:hypothetical protein